MNNWGATRPSHSQARLSALCSNIKLLYCARVVELHYSFFIIHFSLHSVIIPALRNSARGTHELASAARLDANGGGFRIVRKRGAYLALRDFVEAGARGVREVHFVCRKLLHEARLGKFHNEGHRLGGQLAWNLIGVNVHRETAAFNVASYARSNALYGDFKRLFGKGKSASCSLATYGFKTGNKTLSNVSGKPDNVVACELVERKRTDCAKVSYSLDKTGIKKALKKRDSQIEELFEMEVVERFYVEPKTDKEVGE